MRKFKVDGRVFEIINICDVDYKYKVLLHSKYLVTIGKCNTLAMGKEIAIDFIEREKEIEKVNLEYENNLKKHIEERMNSKICCDECGKELNSEEKLNTLFDTCEDCLKKHISKIY